MNNDLYLNGYFAYLNKFRRSPESQPFVAVQERKIEGLRHSISEFTGIDLQKGEVDFEKLKNLSFQDKEKLIELLVKLYNLTGNKSFEEIADFLKNSLEEEAQTERPERPQESGTNEKETSDFEKAVIDQKAKKYGDFAYEKAKNSSFTATKSPRIDTSSLNGLSRTQLVEMFDPEVFYSLSDKQRETLYQAVVNDYLIEQGVPPCAVELGNLPIGKNQICFGQYDPARGKIELNKHLFDNIDELSNVSNAHLPYHILSTLIHEAHHRVQFMNIDKEPKSEADKLVKNSLVEPQAGKSFKDYLAEPDEVDARNASLAYLRECATSQDKPKNATDLAKFYNDTKTSEMKNGKSSVPQPLMDANPDIYDPKLFEHLPYSPIGATSRKEMFDMILGNSRELDRSRQKSF